MAYMINIFIAEDQQMLLGALGSLLNLEDDMKVVGKGTTGQDAVEFAKNTSPMYALWTLKCPVRQDLKQLRN